MSRSSPALHKKKVVIGYDRRFLSDLFARRAAEVFAGNGYAVVLTPDPTPTPSVSFEAAAQHAIGGVMITASHNPLCLRIRRYLPLKNSCGLADAGITFQQLVEDTRRELAHHYLKHSTVELNEAAFLLGYEDANSFFRAFHGWEGTSPGEWRMKMRGVKPEVSAPSISANV